ncbi:hypothetical protein CC77DRAFT_1032279 [Alternaria alternata]|uniref:Uncharacterized protein n=1 Tax=Alternaria alternata TaxID=5599 RepID=A0A177DIE4_ALTAL|nr:hypothetical protein CC77DRAFT_1032279 [Alternaria alternata]OAG18812.1 hypothetical protein CC77DRAFT_1032279 [Alternaria alternata]
MSSRSSRSHSFSSDKTPSLASSVTFQMPATVRPAPAYIAASVASQTVTDHHNAQLRDQDADTDELQNAIFSEQALALLNAFLDHLLFAFLSSARSPALAAIRPAVSDVLKPRLARDAIEAADEELQGLLAGEDDEDMSTEHAKQMDRWDVEKVWKRTRLRIMVYTRLGELEDEDEERYVQQERGLSMDEDEDDEAGLVAWASAIFLTSVVEYVAEQLLLVAGSAAFARMAARMKKLAQQADDHAEQQPIERLVIEEPDVEKIALNSALGRLWRTWRKRVRSPTSPISPGRGVHAASSYSSLHHRRASRETINTLHSEHEIREHETLPEHPPTETDIAANIPLPMRDNDVNEIEVPGLAPPYGDEGEREGTQTPVQRPMRPSSVLVLSQGGFGDGGKKARPMSMPMRPAGTFMPSTYYGYEEPTGDEEEPTHDGEESTHDTERGTPSQATEETTPQTTQETTLDNMSQQRDLVDSREDESPEPDASMVAFAAATGMGFRRSAIGQSATKEPETEPTHQVMRSKRMSIERAGKPGLVRTFSTRSSSLKSPVGTPLATPKVTGNAEGRSYLDDDEDDEEPEHRAIGVARTSDNVIRSASNSPGDSPHERNKRPGSGGYVEVPPRNFTPTSLTYRNTPSPDGKPTVPERAVERKQANRRSLNGAELVLGPGMGGGGGGLSRQSPGGEAVATYDSQGPTSAPRRQEARSVSRGSSLPALQEVESNTTQHRGKTPSIQTSRSVRTADSSRRSPTSATDTSEKRPHRMSADDSTRPADKSSSDNSSLKRGASTSSSIRKGAYPITSSGRDSSASHRSRGLSASGLSGRMSEEDRAREFDSLVKGQDTVKFTLTPESVRTTNESPVLKKTEPRKSSASSASVTVYPRTDASDKSFGTANLPNTTAPRAKGPTTASSHKPSPSRKVVTRPLARDPKIESESMRDFADFIRSTGPSPGQEKPIQPFVNISNNGQKSGNHSTSSLGRKMSTSRQSGNANNTPATRTRPNMEPRSPAGLSTGNGDLIDFIRQGPPDANHKQPRIPKNIAPFRTTVDSDTFDTMLGGHGGVETESAYGSAASTLESKDSTATINSRTGLIPSPSVVQPAYSGGPGQLSGSMSGGGDAMEGITKTRRRIKDPYAIDLSDEDDDEDDDEDEDQLTALPTPTGNHQPERQLLQQQPAQRQAAPPRQREESLMDFLNGMDPPGGASSAKPQPFLLSEETIAAARARAAAGQNGSNPSSSNLPASRNGNGTAPSPSTNKPRLQARAPAVVGDARTGMGAMGGGGSRTATSDLADFLKNSGPPEPVVQTRREEVPEKKKRFWQRGKSSGKTYGDLP